MDGSIGTNKLPYSLNKLASGLLVPPFTTQELIDELRKMSLRKDDVFVVTFPKSGTTWMQQVVKLIHRNGEDNNEVIVKAAPWLERVGSSGIKVNTVYIDVIVSVPNQFQLGSSSTT